MSAKRITVVIEECVQVGVREYRMKRISKNFSIHRSIKEMFLWAESEGIKNPTINDISFCDYIGDSS